MHALVNALSSPLWDPRLRTLLVPEVTPNPDSIIESKTLFIAFSDVAPYLLKRGGNPRLRFLSRRRVYVFLEAARLALGRAVSSLRIPYTGRRAPPYRRCTRFLACCFSDLLASIPPRPPRCRRQWPPR
jgi:hypothetical protein